MFVSYIINISFLYLQFNNLSLPLVCLWMATITGQLYMMIIHQFLKLAINIFIFMIESGTRTSIRRYEIFSYFGARIFTFTFFQFYNILRIDDEGEILCVCVCIYVCEYMCKCVFQYIVPLLN